MINEGDEYRRIFQCGHEPLIKEVIRHITEEAQKAKTVKDSVDQTALNLAKQEGRIMGASQVLQIIHDRCK